MESMKFFLDDAEGGGLVEADGYGACLSTEDFDRITNGLEQRRHAEQQACQAAERRVVELEGLLRRVVESSVLSFEMDAPEKLESLEVDICAALAEPVPPAGGEVEVPAMPDTVDRRPYDDEDPEGYLEGDDDWSSNNPGAVSWLADNHAEIRQALVDRAQVTRLQAEVERLKQVAIDRKNEQTKLCTERNDLQSELTKARELWATEQAIKEQPGEDVLWQVLDAAVGVLTRRAAPHAWESEAFEAGRKIIMARREGLIATAPNQSAPAECGACPGCADGCQLDRESPPANGVA